MVKGHAGVPWTPDIAFDVADYLSGVRDVGYWAAEGFHVRFVADYGHVCALGMEELFLRLSVGVWESREGKLHSGPLALYRRHNQRSDHFPCWLLVERGESGRHLGCCSRSPRRHQVS